MPSQLDKISGAIGRMEGGVANLLEDMQGVKSAVSKLEATHNSARGLAAGLGLVMGGVGAKIAPAIDLLGK